MDAGKARPQFNEETLFEYHLYTLSRTTGMGRGEAGGPLDTTLTITVYIFRNFYERANSVGYAAAVSILLFFIILGLTLLQFRVLSRRVHYQ